MRKEQLEQLPSETIEKKLTLLFNLNKALLILMFLSILGICLSRWYYGKFIYTPGLVMVFVPVVLLIRQRRKLLEQALQKKAP